MQRNPKGNLIGGTTHRILEWTKNFKFWKNVYSHLNMNDKAQHNDSDYINILTCLFFKGWDLPCYCMSIAKQCI